MSNKQTRIPGLEELERSVANAQEKRGTLREETEHLKDRVLKLELEVSLLRIQLERGKRTSEEKKH